MAFDIGAHVPDRRLGPPGVLRGKALAAAYAERLRALEAENAHLRRIVEQLEVAANSPDSAPLVLSRRRRVVAAAATR